MKTILLQLLLLLSSASLTAQWTSVLDQNTLVSNSTTADIKSIGTSDGQTYVAYWKNLPAPAYYEMRLQLLDENGVQQFGPEGMLVNAIVPMSSFTATWSLAIDEADNALLAFNGTGSGNPVYAHKIATDGTQLWGATGVNVGSGFDPKVLPLSSGEAIVAWLPGNKGVFQKVSAAGAPLYASAVTIEPTISTSKSSAGEMVELSNGDFVILFHNRTGFSPSSTFYGQRYTPAGATVWATPVQLATSSTVFNRRYDLLQNADTIYLGYSASIVSSFSSYLQRIDPDGGLPWGLNGRDFSTSTAFYERDTKIAREAGSPYIWSICEYTNSAQSQYGEYVQKFDMTSGARLLTDLAKEVFPVSSSLISHAGSLQLVDDQPLFVSTNGVSDGVNPVDLIATYLDANGDFAWVEQTRDVATFAGPKSRVDFSRSAAGQSVCVWVGDRPALGGKRSFAQNVLVGCSAAQAPQNPVSTVGVSSTVLSWDPVPQSIGCRVSGERTSPPGPMGQANIVGVEPSSFSIPHSATGSGSTWSWSVLCACNISPLEVTPSTAAISFTVPSPSPSASPRLEQDNEITVFPNPALNNVLINLQPASQEGTLSIFNASGKLMQFTSYQAGESTFEVNLANWPPGIYFYQFESLNIQAAEKEIGKGSFVKE